MRKKRGIILAAVLAAVLGGLAWLLFFTGEPEPVYEGKRLSTWLEAYANPISADPAKEIQDAQDAVRHIGTNAIPTLLRMLRARDSALTLKLLTLAEKQHLVKINYVPADARHWQALMAFDALGSKAKDAVPGLIRIYEQNISLSSRVFTLRALASIGPDAKTAVPMLLKVAADTNNSDPKALHLREYAFEVLGFLHAEPQLVVPALVNMLSDSDRFVRQRAAWVLGEFGPDAKSAAPALFELLKDPQSVVQFTAAFAIRKIDPEAAAQRKTEIDAALAPVKPQ